MNTDSTNFNQLKRARRLLGALLLIITLTLTTSTRATESVVWQENFEGGFPTEWSVSGGTWEVGIPTVVGPPAAHEGIRSAATVIGGNYSDGVSTRFQREAFTVPPASEYSRLRFWHWYSFSCDDYGEVQIKVGTNDWKSLGSQYSGTSGGVWSPATPTDLTAYAGQTVQIAFYFFSQNSGCNGGAVDVSSGWYVDDICLVSGILSARITTPGGSPGSSLALTTNEESFITFTASATETNAQSNLRYNLGQRPPNGASINPVTGVFTWTPTEAQGPATYVIPVNIVDIGNAGWMACTFATIAVNEVNKAPIFMERNRTIGEGQFGSWSLCGTDADIPANPLTYMKLSGPTNFMVTPSGQATWFPAQMGSYSVTVKVTDNNPRAVNATQLSATNSFNVTVVPTNSLYLYSLKMQRVSQDSFDFTIMDGRVGSNYVLQCAPAIFDCPPTNHWQDITSVHATTMPFTFGYTVPNFATSTNRFYRLRTQ